jgi:hypothetical protein
MSTIKQPLVLPYGRLETGMPVIVNHTDQPCTRLVAVITGFSESGNPVMRYLNSSLDHPTMEMGIDSVTPLEAFGVAIELDEANGLYRCVEVPGAPKSAVYRDGEPRKWQQYPSDREWWPYRLEVLAKLDKAFIIGNF